ncbi:DUF6443 domain-containing protein [Flavobacterium litorale]|uniref:Carbohydrate binding domain-containing protein n=1 Tax=Flavobacterium litorale TaxID=2856519 RepID=A0ABX8V8I1_9FLAO|nr:DUF6443 domain-containing protein [Flavobacterium litorale]QYJ68822.1 carbohydrate binding domain-containing protein [Flavobacterium litorale]
MKNIVYILLLLPILGFSQTETENYVKSMTYRTAHSATAVQDTSKARTNITYLDGLGRPIQQIVAKASGNEKNIVTHIEYDEFGRQIKQYLPYASSSSDFDYEPNALTNTQNFYNTPKYENTQNPYSQSFLENSPLNRTRKQAAPGNPWEGTIDIDNNVDNDDDHTVKIKYQLNKAAEVRYFDVAFEEENSIENPEKPRLVYKNYYDANQLYKTITKDENWVPADGNNKTTEEFTDDMGRVVLKRNYDNDQPHDTYYVYDKFSNLTYVIPPLAADQIVQETSTLLNPGNNYPWTSLSQVDAQLAQDYGRYLQDYENAEILNLDLIDQYGGQGGFSVTPQSDGTLTMSINIATSTPMPYRTGIILDLKDIGTFQDTEIGRVSGTGYSYTFIIKGNTIEVQGNGDVPSLNTAFNSAQQLSYSMNYPWTAFCKADATVARDYENDIATLDNSEILTTYTPNPYGAMGGIAITVDENDAVTLAINLSSTTPLEFNQGNVITLPLQRSLPDMDFGVIGGAGYNYGISIKGNELNITGSGQFNNVNFSGNLLNDVTFKVRFGTLYGLCYIYHYDSRNRVIEKHIPDAGWTYIVYDKLDRPIVTQDENQRLEDEWLTTKYDALGRVAYTGIYYKPGTTREILQDGANGVTSPQELYETLTTPLTTEGVSFDYTQVAAKPGILRNILTVSYYDDYTTDTDGITVPTTATIPQISTVTKGLPTVTKVRVLENNTVNVGNTHWITTVNAYDEKGRSIWSHSKNNYLGTEDITKTSLDFTGQVTHTESQHKRTGFPDLVVYNRFDYDTQGKLLDHKQSQTPQSGWQIGPYTHVIAQNHYDELGQLAQKGVGGKDNGTLSYIPLQTVDYTYNIRGWLTSINNPDMPVTNDLFAFKINYNLNEEVNAIPLYNGNISETFWRSRTDNIRKGYFYHYDALNRIQLAQYKNGVDRSPANYSTSQITYDKNGNLKKLNRKGLVGGALPPTYDTIDGLIYAYFPDSNQLRYVNDTASATEGFKNRATGSDQDYKYDPNGNMVMDLNKGIGEVEAEQIQYNHLNLPTHITLTGEQVGTIHYVYDATGTKLQKTVAQGTATTITDYANGYVYESTDNNAPVLQFFSHPEGYVTVPAITPADPNYPESLPYYNTNDFEYVYQYKDHLGNTRLSYSDADDDGTINDASRYLVEDSFETQGSWTGFSSYPTGKLRTGSYSARIDNETDIEKIAYMNDWIDIDITQPTEYTFSAWVYTNGPRAELFLYMQDENTTTGPSATSQIQQPPTTLNDWVYVTKTVMVQPNIKKLKLRLDNDGQLTSNTTGYTIWFDDVELKKTNIQSEIIAQDDYYAFGMKHRTIGNVINGGNHLAQKYMYQGQERQDELGLNWDSFKWRNYDYAIGRFMCVDPLAEKYVYNSTYAFQENKLGLGVELEGLEMTSERSEDGKSITLTIRVKPVNNVPLNDKGEQMLTNEQFRSLVEARKAQTIESFNGKTGEGTTVNTNIIESEDATLIWEYNTELHGKGVESDGKSAAGHTDEIGNTQENLMEVNVLTIFGTDGQGHINVSKENGRTSASKTGTHEDGHMGGLKHPEDYDYSPSVRKLHQEINVDGTNNLMTQGINATNITPLQRSVIINTVEEQQTQ